jgi:hypothetical protein
MDDLLFLVLWFLTFPFPSWNYRATWLWISFLPQSITFFSFLKIRFGWISLYWCNLTRRKREPKISMKFTSLLQWMPCLWLFNETSFPSSLWWISVSSSPHRDPLSHYPSSVLPLDSCGQCGACWYSDHKSPEVSTQRSFGNIWTVLNVTIKDYTSLLASWF